MFLLCRLNLNKLAWAIRRYYLPVSSEDLVLEVGSGGNPYPRANVLLDAYEETSHRFWAPLICDRPTVIGFAENLPFKDNVFDFVICAHVLEHSEEPVKFLEELQRVSKAGYIEVPDAFMERLNPYKDHKSEITCREDQLVIRKKHSWKPYSEVVELYEHNVKPLMTQKVIPSNPFPFHVRYYWKDKISFSVINPEVDSSWKSPNSDKDTNNYKPASSIREKLQKIIRFFFSQRNRNKSIDLRSLLRCTVCGGADFSQKESVLHCEKCTANFPYRKNGIIMSDVNNS